MRKALYFSVFLLPGRPRRLVHAGSGCLKCSRRQTRAHAKSVESPGPALRRATRVDAGRLAQSSCWPGMRADWILPLARLAGGRTGLSAARPLGIDALSCTRGRASWRCWQRLWLVAGRVVADRRAAASFPGRRGCSGSAARCWRLLLVNALKHSSQTSCPWDLAAFGGLADLSLALGLGPRDGGPGHCFPAGHASAGVRFPGRLLRAAAGLGPACRAMPGRGARRPGWCWGWRSSCAAPTS